MSEWLFDTLTRPLIPLTLTILCAWIIEKSFAPLTATHKSWIWRCVFLKLMLLLLLPSGMLFSIPPHSLRLDEGAKRVLSMASWANVSTSEENTQVANAETEPLRANATSRGASVGRGVETSVTPISLTISASTQSRSDWSRTLWMNIAIVGWGIGFFYLISHSVYQFIRFRRSLRMLQCDFDSELRVMVANTAKKMGLRHQPRLRVSRAIESPILTLGRRSELVLPAGFGDAHGKEACRMAIAHEMAHYRRHDLYWNFLTTIGTAVYFFWPPVWIATRRYTSSMEMACDQLAISKSKLNRTAYANLLVRLLEPVRMQSTPKTVLSMAWSGSFQTLAERIRSMKLESRFSRLHRILGASICALAMVAVMVPWAIADDEKKSKKGTKSKNNSSGYRSSGDIPPDPPAPSNGNVVRASASASAFGWGSSSSNGSGSSFGSNGGSPGGLFGSTLGRANGMASGGGSVSTGLSFGPSNNSGMNSFSPNSGTTNGTRSSRSGTFSGMSTTSNNNAGVSHGSSTGLSSQSSGVSVSKVTEAIDGESVKVTTIKEKKREVTIRESSDDGIEIRIRESRTGKDKITEIQVDDLESLERDHPEAFEWYRKYAADHGKANAANPLVKGLGGRRQENTSRAEASAMGDASGFGVSGDSMPNDAHQAMEQHIQKLILDASDNPAMQQQLQQMLETVRKNNP